MSLIYKNWMSYISDDVKLTKLIIPGAHNAGTAGMPKMACCQDGSLYEQFTYGIRHFCIRLDTDKKGRLIVCHGITKGMRFEAALADMMKMLEENPSEFFIFDIREYYDQQFGPVTLHFKAEPEKVDEMLEDFIRPSEYALWDFNDISTLTMGDIRASGKRYILYNHAAQYKYSVNCDYIFPWDKAIYGMKAQNFANNVLSMFDSEHTDGLYWFQTQQTPNLGTQIGVTTPRELDRQLRPLFTCITDSIAANPLYLESANIISGDFMTEDYMKSREILKLNIEKGCVKPEKQDEYLKGLEE